MSPKSGPYNLSGTWGGVMGDVINGKYHFSLSQWLHIRERYELMDFVVTSADHQELALTPQMPKVDMGNL